LRQFKKKYYESDGSEISMFGPTYTWKTKE